MKKSLSCFILLVSLLSSVSAFARVSTLDCQQDDFHLVLIKNMTQVSNGTIGLGGLDLSFTGTLNIGNIQASADIENVVKADPGSNIYNVQGADGSSFSSQLDKKVFKLNHVFITPDGKPVTLDGTISDYLWGQTTYMNASVAGKAFSNVPCTYDIKD